MRDLYELDDKVVSVTTDRQSGFDRHLASIPFKGQVVNQTSVWWLRKTSTFVENALLSAPHPNVAIMKKCRVFPVEFVVRGYLTGSTGTSIWTNYSKGVRSYCGNDLPDGLVKNDKLEKNIVTPTTKADEGDVPITPSEIVDQGLMTQQEWDEVSTKALALFNYGQEVARKNGLLLVDTKYEFGVDEDGKILLIDEVSSKRKRRRTRTKLALFFFFFRLTEPLPQDPHPGLQPLLDRGHLRGEARAGKGAGEHRQGVPAALVQGSLRPLQRPRAARGTRVPRGGALPPVHHALRDDHG